MDFPDHFSGAAALYASVRPVYPRALFEFIAGAAPGTACAWDCATGNGQAALGLAGHFALVEATDASAEQVSHALPHPRVRYAVQPAERTDFAPASFDAVCVAQALHWFDTGAFFREAARVLRPGGVLAVFCYNWFSVHAAFDRVFDERFLKVIETSWPAQNALAWNGYRDIEFPFPRLDTPSFVLAPRWNLHELLAFVRSWSGTRRHIAATGCDVLEQAGQALQAAWGDPAERLPVTMPLTLVACRV